VDNLEVLEGAENYTGFLKKTLVDFLSGYGTALDFGAGTGFYAEKLSKEGFTVHCVEHDKNLNNLIKNKNINTFQTLEESKGKYERIYTLDVLEHIEDDIQAMKDLFRKLENNGVLLVYCPAFPVLYSAMDKKIGHYRRYNKKELVFKLESVGFTIKSARYVDSIDFFGSLFYKIFGSKDGDVDSPYIYYYYKFIFPVSRVIDKLTGGKIVGKNVIVFASKVV